MILSPCPDLVGSLRHMSAVGSPSLKPDDSFTSDFAPLPASADSSCLGVNGFAPGGERAGTERPVNGNSNGELDSLDEMASTSQDLPLRMKLEQVRTLHFQNLVSHTVDIVSAQGWKTYELPVTVSIY